MKLISDKKADSYKRFMRKICWTIHDLMKWIREHMFCYHDIDIEHIKEEVKATDDKANKFEQVEKVAPLIQEKLQELEDLKSENIYLKDLTNLLEYHLSELYFAEISNNNNRKKEIFQYLIDNDFIKIQEQISQNNEEKKM
jgi:cell shape-determining protein MreC